MGHLLHLPRVQQVSPIHLGLGRLEQILGLRPGEICEVYGGPGTGRAWRFRTGGYLEGDLT